MQALKFISVFVFFNSIFLFSVFTQLNAAENQKIYQFESDYSIKSFRKAKKYLMKTYADNKKTFYCGCNFNRKKKINADKCGYTARKNIKRGARLEWEHIVPASRFGRPLLCWQQPESFEQCLKKNGKHISGRKCCRKVNKKFRTMEADMVNLVPAVGELNGDRSNYKFALISGEKRRYGTCDFEVNRKTKTVEPALEIRGDIARIYFYMSTKYEMELTTEEISLFNNWANNDPIDQWELTKYQRLNNLLLTLENKQINKQQFAADE